MDAAVPVSPADGSNRLFFGDNLDILREQVGDASVDLVYLDPLFDSNVSLSCNARGNTEPDRNCRFRRV